MSFIFEHVADNDLMVKGQIHFPLQPAVNFKHLRRKFFGALVCINHPYINR